eukprot:TRINITY_DN10859_c0_g1_i2.p5 TRINITY_DN10859_c0_g1~~TRINITY_DN10859_c0_g1_i2.p5  ORF type:complete len:107 (-),score=2.59 TRINITY_DN10859_c0_g1_i2:546-866(-)
MHVLAQQQNLQQEIYFDTWDRCSYFQPSYVLKNYGKFTVTFFNSVEVDNSSQILIIINQIFSAYFCNSVVIPAKQTAVKTTIVLVLEDKYFGSQYAAITYNLYLQK